MDKIANKQAAKGLKPGTKIYRERHRGEIVTIQKYSEVQGAYECQDTESGQIVTLTPADLVKDYIY